MSRARHMKRAEGGKVVAYNAADSNVMKEARERKRGGRVHEGEGEKAHHRMDKKKRARGGAVGADKRPLSSAANFKKLPMEEAGTEGMEHEGSKVHNP